VRVENIIFAGYGGRQVYFSAYNLAPKKITLSPNKKKLKRLLSTGMFRPEMLLPMGLPEGVNVIGRILDALMLIWSSVDRPPPPTPSKVVFSKSSIVLVPLVSTVPEHIFLACQFNRFFYKFAGIFYYSYVKSASNIQDLTCL
jgi:hypothetical protein